MRKMFPQFPPEISVTGQEQQRCIRLISNLILKIGAAKKPPKTLYHYTTPSGFKGILESGVLRATHVAYTNDASEHLHAVQVLRSCVSERRKAECATEIQNLLIAVEQGLTNTTPFNTMPIAISCFCENGDLLSQWRGYGLGEGGIAIGFDTTKVIASLNSWNGFLTPVLYKEAEQKKLAIDLLDGIISEYQSVLRSRQIATPETHLSDFLTVLGAHAARLAPLFKHSGFTEEDEWRLLCPIMDMEKVQFLAKSTYLSPFVELTIGTKRDGKNDLLPIRDILFGPGRYQEHAVHSCGALLSSLGYFNIPLHRSQTPFRSIA
jgi:hypothetical protein